MKIFFSKKEYRALLDMLYLADWLIFANETDDNTKPDTKKYKQLRNKILTHYKEMGCEDIIDKPDSNIPGYYETREYEELMNEKFIDEYDEQNFWSELIDKLAKRDLINEVGDKAFKNMDSLTRASKLSEKITLYDEEFAKNGIDDLFIKNKK